jgi:mono/diheme cytochrome c family protein
VRWMSTMSLAAALAIPGAVTGIAQDVDNGRRLAERWCAECHAIGSKPTRFRRGLRFAALASKDTVTFETLTAFLLLPHATMSNVSLSRNDARDIAAFIIAMKK